jgi:thiol-disulfide isomerase/thioredoxin
MRNHERQEQTMSGGKQKLFSLLSFLGLVFFLALVTTYFIAYSKQGELIENKVEVQDDFAGQFSQVRVRNRLEPMVEASFLNPAGEALSWDAFAGDYLLVNLWATWCAPCVLELPSLEKLQERYDGKGLQVIAISLDTTFNQEQVKNFLQHRGIGEFAAYMDQPGDIQRNLAIRGIPTSLLLNPQGEVTHIFEGDARWTSAPAIGFFEELLAQP